MLRFAILSILLVTLMPLCAAQETPKSDQTFDMRCMPKPLSRETVSNKFIHHRKGEPMAGSVGVAWQVLDSGKVTNVRVERTSGFPGIDAAAISMIQEYKHNRRSGCSAMEIESTISIRWDLF